MGEGIISIHLTLKQINCAKYSNGVIGIPGHLRKIDYILIVFSSRDLDYR